MSLAFLQGYSSPEEESEENHLQYENPDSSEDEDDKKDDQGRKATSIFDFPKSSSSTASGLPSAADVFSDISGPPDFLNNCVQEETSTRDAGSHRGRHGYRNKVRKDKKDLPPGAVLESKAQLIGIRERVRSDVEGNQPPKSTITSTAQGGKRAPTATNPSAEDAAALLRMCLQCGIPKTFTNAAGMVCPTCGDRPVEATDDSKKKGSTIKDKEKNKRMKGQSSHATWKSETEMQLRQQFD